MVHDENVWKLNETITKFYKIILTKDIKNVTVDTEFYFWTEKTILTIFKPLIKI